MLKSQQNNGLVCLTLSCHGTKFFYRERLLDNPTCDANCHEDKFFFLAKGRTLLHFLVLETTIITICQPGLRKHEKLAFLKSSICTVCISALYLTRVSEFKMLINACHN